MITPTFHFKILDIFVDVFVEKSEILVKKLQSKVGEKAFDIYPFITHCALDIICGEYMLKHNSLQFFLLKNIFPISHNWDCLIMLQKENKTIFSVFWPCPSSHELHPKSFIPAYTSGCHQLLCGFLVNDYLPWMSC